MGAKASLASDVFQLGLILYEMLTGRRDFRSPDVVDTLRGFLVRDRRLLSPEGEKFMVRFQQVFQMCVAAEPVQRFPDAGRARKAFIDLKKALRELSPSRVSKAIPIGSMASACETQKGTAGPTLSAFRRTVSSIGRIVSLVIVLLIVGFATLVTTLVVTIYNR
jgi:serine/threonine protein kinase